MARLLVLEVLKKETVITNKRRTYWMWCLFLHFKIAYCSSNVFYICVNYKAKQTFPFDSNVMTRSYKSFWFSTVLFLAKCIVIFYFDLFRAPPVPMLLVTSIKISTWEKETPVLLQSTDLESSTFQTIESLFTLPLVLPG